MRCTNFSNLFSE